MGYEVFANAERRSESMKRLSRLEKNNRTRLEEILSEDPFFFAPRWISRYVVRSIELCGDMSLAFDLLEGEPKLCLP